MMKRQMKQGVAALLAAAMLLAGSLTAMAETKIKLDTPDGLWWDGEVAKWDEVDEAKKYEVVLYRDESKQTSVTTTSTKYDFKMKITKDGDYSFKVKAIAKTSGDYKDSNYSDYSDSISFAEDYAADMAEHTAAETTSVYQNQGLKEPGALNTIGSWQQNTVGWWYQRTDGSYPKNMWFRDPQTAKWYYFDGSGYMKTGWIDYNGGKYYCGADGAMYENTIQTIDGQAHIFDASGLMTQ